MKNLSDKELSIFIGQRIQYFRKQRKFTQKQLAEKIDRTQHAVSYYEKGLNAPSQDVLFAIANALDVPIDDFFPERDFKISNDVTASSENLSNEDIEFLTKLTAYVETLPVEEKEKLFHGIDVAIELFKHQNK